MADSQRSSDAQDQPELWDRLPNEPARDYQAFRLFRDRAPHLRNRDDIAEEVNVDPRTVGRWMSKWDWRSRAEAWDAACYQVEDRERLDLIREMHTIHRKAGRAAVTMAQLAIDHFDVSDLTPTTAARLLELGAKLERSTLIVSVEELQGLETIEDESDPWERIAQELDPRNAPVEP